MRGFPMRGTPWAVTELMGHRSENQAAQNAADAIAANSALLVPSCVSQGRCIVESLRTPWGGGGGGASDVENAGGRMGFGAPPPPPSRS